MIEVVYGGNNAAKEKRSDEYTSEKRTQTQAAEQGMIKPENTASFYKSSEEKKPTIQALKNIRQIGSADPYVRIYVEDTVMRFLKEQQQYKLNMLLALLGTAEYANGQDIIYIQGALLADHIRRTGSRLEFDKQAFMMIQEDMETFFPELKMVGWYLPEMDLLQSYGSVLGEKGDLFCVPEEEREADFYRLQNGQVTAQRGYYIYYEINTEMKNYLMTCDKKLKEAQEESRKLQGEGASVQNRADGQKEQPYAEDYEEAQLQEKEKGRLTNFLYATSAVLAIVVLVVGITMVNNYEKMYELQNSLDTVVSALQQSEQAKVQEAAAKPADSASGKQPDTAAGGPEAEDAQKTTDSSAATENEQKTEENAAEDAQQTSAQIPEEDFADGYEQGEESTLQYYTIQKGDTLASISRKIYNTEDKISAICEANNIESENELIVGEKILLP